MIYVGQPEMRTLESPNCLLSLCELGHLDALSFALLVDEFATGRFSLPFPSFDFARTHSIEANTVTLGIRYSHNCRGRRFGKRT